MSKSQTIQVVQGMMVSSAASICVRIGDGAARTKGRGGVRFLGRGQLAPSHQHGFWGAL